MTQTLSARVASAVRAEVARRKISQSEIAGLLGISQASLSRRMTGLTPFDIDEVDKIAAHLELPVASLFEDSAA